MFKNLVFVGLLLALVGVGAQAQSATAVTRVARATYTGQTASISTTTLFTPAADGDYLVEIYDVLEASASEESDAQVFVSWNDGIRTETWGQCDANNGALFAHPTECHVIIHATSENPIQFSVTYGTIDSTPYDLYINVLKMF